MGTKTDPGRYDCYHKAAPDEPMFVLLARDPLAPTLVRLWADLTYSRAGNGAAKSAEAKRVAADMDTWRTITVRRVAAEAGIPLNPKEEQHGS